MTRLLATLVAVVTTAALACAQPITRQDFDALADRVTTLEAGPTWSGVTIQSGGTAASPQRTILNFLPAGLVLTPDDPIGGRTEIVLDVTPSSPPQLLGSTRQIATTAPLTGGGNLTGDLTLGFSTFAAHGLLAGPTSGGPATPTVRLLVASDIPPLDASIITSGALSVARGGFGTSAGGIVKGTIPIGSGPGAFGFLGGGLDGQQLVRDSGAALGVSWGGMGGPQVANRVFAGPVSGGDAAAAFRLLVPGDIPFLDASIINSGAVALARGGLGANVSTIAKGGLLVGTGAGSIGIQPVGPNGTTPIADSTQASGIRWDTVAGGGTVGGTGTAGRLAFWSGGTTIGASDNLLWDDGAQRMTMIDELRLVHQAVPSHSQTTLRASVRATEPPSLEWHRASETVKGDFFVARDSQANQVNHPHGARLTGDFSLYVRQILDSQLGSFFLPPYWEPGKLYRTGDRVLFRFPEGDRYYRAVQDGVSGTTPPAGIPYAWTPLTQYQAGDLLVALVTGNDPQRLYTIAPIAGQEETCRNHRTGSNCCTTDNVLSSAVGWPTAPAGTVDRGSCRITCAGACAVGDAQVQNVVDGGTMWSDQGRGQFYASFSIGGDGKLRPMNVEHQNGGKHMLAVSQHDNQAGCLLADLASGSSGSVNTGHALKQNSPRFCTSDESVRAMQPAFTYGQNHSEPGHKHAGFLYPANPGTSAVGNSIRIDTPEYPPQLRAVATGDNALTQGFCYWIGFAWEGNTWNSQKTDWGPMGRVFVGAPNNAIEVTIPGGCPAGAGRAWLGGYRTAGACTEERPSFLRLRMREQAIPCTAGALPAAPQVAALDWDDFPTPGALGESEVLFPVNLTAPWMIEIATRSGGLETWEPNHGYTRGAAGPLILPTNRDGRQYMLWRTTTPNGTACTSGGSEPNWDVAFGEEVPDGTCFWRERGREPALFIMKGAVDSTGPGDTLQFREGAATDRVTGAVNATGDVYLTRYTSPTDRRYLLNRSLVLRRDLNGGGGLELGPGGGANPDVTLYRGGANLLQTDDSFSVLGGTLGLGTLLVTDGTLGGVHRATSVQNGKAVPFPLLMMHAKATGALDTAAARYLELNATLGAPATTLGAAESRLAAMRLLGMWCSVDTPPGAGASWTMTVSDDGSGTTITCPISGATATTCDVWVGTGVDVADGSEGAVSVTPANTPAAASHPGCQVFYVLNGSASGAVPL